MITSYASVPSSCAFSPRRFLRRGLVLALALVPACLVALESRQSVRASCSQDVSLRCSSCSKITAHILCRIDNGTRNLRIASRMTPRCRFWRCDSFIGSRYIHPFLQGEVWREILQDHQPRLLDRAHSRSSPGVGLTRYESRRSSPRLLASEPSVPWVPFLILRLPKAQKYNTGTEGKRNDGRNIPPKIIGHLLDPHESGITLGGQFSEGQPLAHDGRQDAAESSAVRDLANDT